MTEEENLLIHHKSWARDVSAGAGEAALFGAIFREWNVPVIDIYEALAAEMVSVPGVLGVAVRRSEPVDEVWVASAEPSVAAIKLLSDLQADFETANGFLLELRVVGNLADLPDDANLQYTPVG